MHVMGLAERLEVYQQEQARKQAEVQIALRQQLRQQEKKRVRILNENQLRLIADKKAREALIDQMSTFLEAVGARENLQAVRKFWGAGEIDKQPVLIGTKEAGYALALGIRFGFSDAEVISTGSYDFPYSVSPHATILCQEEASLIVAVQFSPSVSSRYTLNDLTKNNYGGAVHQSSFELHSKILNSHLPEIFSMDQPNQAKRTLADQLEQIVTSTPSPLELASEAKVRVNKAPFIPKGTLWFARIFG